MIGGRAAKWGFRLLAPPPPRDFAMRMALIGNAFRERVRPKQKAENCPEAAWFSHPSPGEREKLQSKILCYSFLIAPGVSILLA